MKTFGKTGLAISIALRGAWAVADTEAGLCPVPSSTEELLKCAIHRAPASRKAEGYALEAQAQTASAGQLPNPELGADYLKAKGESELTVGLQFPLTEFLSRQAKLGAAEALESAAQTRFASVQVESKIETLLKLHRLRQYFREKELVEEALQTFAKLVKQYESRPQLPPEQEVSLAVFRMAESDYKLQQLSLMQEEAKLRNFFVTVTGLELEQIKKILPKGVDSWPEYKEGPTADSAPDLKIAQAELRRTEADQRYARISSWPELKLGPTMKRLSSGAETSTSWGAAVGLSIPIFSLNAGERGRTAQAIANAELDLALVRQEIAQKRNELIRVYQSSTQALKTTLSPIHLTKNHERIDRLFARGIVPSSLVIEAHRSLVDLEKNRNEKEIAAIEALWSLRALDGTAMEATL